ncbi:exocyst complex component 3-like protein 4 [Seriola lalandi dorsalis]|uniref:Exocyst complex component 3-like 4 n=2 Tax=Seriola lalandi dorsalis TaxID=1841481 RepID=A0A3B4XRY0_SERLL|nr:exocyst complex component 3-like protein 4 [Seriola lalandi dorsalis]XP_023268713.1 exocyst complex component 3-like protein 4 [Seriola lalandi dorsalis]
MDKSTENPEEDTVSLRSNGKTPACGVTKEKQGFIRTFRESARRVAAKNPLSPGGKGSKVKPEADTAGKELGIQTPPSPSPSTGSVKSPLKMIGSIFQSKQENNGDVPQQKSISIKRTKTDPNMSATHENFMRGRLTQSMNFGGRRLKNKNAKENKAVPEGTLEEKEEEKEEEVLTEVEETYTLPELPHTLLSVMEISKLIEMKELEDSHLHLLALRQEFQQEKERCGEVSPVELMKKEKDLSLLYGNLRNKITAIVRDSNSPSSGNEELLLPLARIIQEEEKRAEEPGSLQGSWMEAWREAVGEGVKVKLESVGLEQREQKASWLADHLGLLGKTIVEDLENVKRKLRWSYPPSFKVFGTYVKSYHRGVAQHLKKLEQQATELRELYSLLDWIINTYKSECIMGSQSLQPEMNDESTELQLEENFLKQLKDKYCSKVKGDIRDSLNRVIEIEIEEVWKVKKDPEEDENYFVSHIPMDIWTKMEGVVKNSRRIDAELEQKATSSCLEELKPFPNRFEEKFNCHCSTLKPQPLWTNYQITYINTFTVLQQHMEGYLATCPGEVEGFRREAKCLIVRLLQGLEDQFKEEVKPFLRRMMTRKWLNDDSDFTQLYKRTETLSQHCALMRPPHLQEFASRLHYHVAREYIGQLMKNYYSCKNRKHENAASKIRHQWDKLRFVFVDMESTHEWLHSVGDELCDIIGQKKNTEIKNNIEPLVKQYPDFSKSHLVAVLNFRGLVRGREYQLILQRFTELKKKLSGGSGGDRSRVFFGDMQVTINTNCLSNLPFSCCLLPNNC